MTALAGNTYTYDANGNQITRVIGADTFNLKYDAENRLVEVKKNNVVIAAFTFDADGKRVKSVIDQETILFVGAHFEIKNGNQITKYYMAGTTRIAMHKYTIPQPMMVEYMFSDHLGSTSLTADADGNKVLEIRYREASRAVLWRVDTQLEKSDRRMVFGLSGFQSQVITYPNDNIERERIH